ncbi:MAG: BolA family transcriptional regulator [Bdellovibrionales bacterium]|nr:BolA family transcriptional regulator [Bdellovibrionales bacterium]
MTESEVENRLKQAFPDCDAVIQDLTGGGSNFEVRIASEVFSGMNRVKQHQAVMKVFDPELKSGEIHALSIKTLTK